MQFPLRFMVDHKLVGGGWVKVGAACPEMRARREKEREREMLSTEMFV